MVACNPSMENIKPYGMVVRLLVEGRLKGLNNMLRILDINGPYHRRQGFWDSVMDSGILHDSALIVVGDLKLTLSANEVWGASNIIDPLVSCFIGFSYST